jgi:OmpA-OmpF porin, OOP family
VVPGSSSIVAAKFHRNALTVCIDINNFLYYCSAINSGCTYPISTNTTYMKQNFYKLCLIIAWTILALSDLNAQKHGFTFRQNWYNYISPRQNQGLSYLDRDLGDIIDPIDWRGMEFAYQRFLSADQRTSLLFPLKFGVARIPELRNSPGKRYAIGNADILLQRNLFRRTDYFINPYISFGFGTTYNFDTEDWSGNIPVALGLNFRIAENLYINAQTQYREAFNKQIGWHHGLGLVVKFGDLEAKDTDGDGISDDDDKCPSLPGVASLMGCPDRDMDGITDSDDRCPDVKGTERMFGCPEVTDRDMDGVADADDKCPDTKGLATLKGCPDRDGDGIADADDKCPDAVGPVSLQGCPPVVVADGDGDGIADKDDACPTVKGVASARGCPDADGDGVADKDDACPDKKGSIMQKGCPDTDGDGIYDNDDRCVTQPGTAANRGCPEIKAEDKAKLQNVIRNVQFETGKATLLTKSYAVLDEVVKIMNDYPAYSLTISGHTDSQGDDASNQSLSERRAKACYDYLVSKGVAAARMSHAGYGETRPIADNATKEGRDRNRRVDFDLTVK